MDKRLITGLVSVMMLVLLIFVGCVKDDKSGDDEHGKISLDAEVIYLTVGDVHNFVLNSSDKSGNYKWSVKHSVIAEVDDGGNFKANAVGETRVSVQSENGQTAGCKVIIGDSIVSTAFKDAENLPKNRYKSIQEAVDIGGNIIVMAGEYEEYVTAKEAISLLGVDGVSMRGISGKSVTADNISFIADTPPSVDGSTVSASEELNLKNCNFTVTVNAEQPKNNTGGYAVYVAESVKRVNIYNCNFNNYRYAIYVDKAAAEISITENSLSKNKFGIGVNLALGMSNAKASGVIKDNIYTDCVKSNEFIFNGGDYRGDLDYEDFFTSPPNKEPSDKN